MKFSIDIECETEEARSFFGLADGASRRQALMAGVEAPIERGREAADFETPSKTRLPAGLEYWRRPREMMYSRLAGAGGKGGKT